MGPFPDVYEHLIMSHLRRNDTQAALVASDRMVSVFPSWGRALWFASRVYDAAGEAGGPRARLNRHRRCCRAPTALRPPRG